MTALPAGYRLVAIDRVDSTNEEAKRLAARGGADGTVVWAREQTAGRGRRGRTWVSPPGNLYCSVLLRPACSVATAAQIGFVAGMALSEVVSEALPDARVCCKWPNDILVNGRKIAGILIETSAAGGGPLDWLILGMGVNVADHPPATDATSLDAEGGNLTVEELLTLLTVRFAAWRNTWSRQGFGPVRAAWLDRAGGLGAPIAVRLERETLNGTFADLDADGALVLEAAGERRRITAGDVFSLGA